MKQPKNKINNMSDIAARRAGVYQLLSQIFLKPPSSMFLRKMKNSLEKTAYASVSIKGLDVVYTILNGLRDDYCDRFAGKLSMEFTRLFRGVSNNNPTPPYESAYTEGILWGQSTVRVLKWYQRLGVSVNTKYRNEPPDHISFELSFMQFLCNKEAEEWGRDDRHRALTLLEMEERFLSEHLLKWVFSFCDSIRRNDRLGFYRGWVDFLGEWVRSDYHHVKEKQLALRGSQPIYEIHNVVGDIK